jgi:sigma-B regulation protein RsbU (phosphoserine phosphatase)
VLVADDDPLIADYLCLVLEALGCVPVQAPDGKAALERLGEQHFDVLLTDWMMPEMDGIELVQRARSLQQGYLHVILMTAQGEERTVRTAIDAGVDDFLYKPFETINIELGITAARRVVQLQRRLERRNRHLIAAHERTQTAYRQLKADLMAAAEMQKRLLPADRLHGPLRHISLFTPSLDIGGDTLGVIDLANGRRLFFDIDVSGHGVPAALNSFALHSRLTRLAPGDPEALAEAAQTLNEELLAQGGDAYMTAVFGIAEGDGSRLWLIRAGHPLPILLPAQGQPRFLDDGGLPLGMIPGVRHHVQEVALAPGDRLLIYSDGVTESGIGEDGLVEAFERQRQCALPEMMGALEWRLLQTRAGQPPEDDVSMLAIERAPA